jgi:hypothetical protein
MPTISTAPSHEFELARRHVELAAETLRIDHPDAAKMRGLLFETVDALLMAEQAYASRPNVVSFPAAGRTGPQDR